MASDHHIKVKLKKNKTREDEIQPGYSLSYKTNVLDPNQAAYAILSELAQKHDVIIELNTELFLNFSTSKRDHSTKFLNDIRSRNLKCSFNKMPSDRHTAIFGVPIGNGKKETAQKIAAYVPNLIWKEESFRSVLPACGARYYIVEKPIDAEVTVNSLWNMSEEEKAVMFGMIIFNMAEFGQMGIVTNTVGEEELKRLLGV